MSEAFWDLGQSQTLGSFFLLNIRSIPVLNGQAIGDCTGPQDNFTKKVGHGAAPGGQLICFHKTCVTQFFLSQKLC